MDITTAEGTSRGASSPVASLLKLLATGYFVRSVSLARLGSSDLRTRIPAACAVGLGCRHQRGASAGAPIETLGLIFRAVLACRELGVPRLYCVVGGKLAQDSLGQSQREAAAAAAREHHMVIERVARATREVEVVPILDSEILGGPRFAHALTRVEGYLGTPFDYLARAAALFEVVEEEYGATLKVGWTRLGERQAGVLSKVKAQLEEGSLPRASCEVVFDVFRDLHFAESGSGALYGPAAIPLYGLVRQACPYVTSRDARGTRVMLHPGELLNLEFKVPRMEEPERSARVQEAMVLISLLGLVALSEELHGDLIPSRSLIRSSWTEFMRARRRVEAVQSLHGTAGREFSAAATALNSVAVEMALRSRGAIVSAMRMLISEFSAEE